MGRIEKSSGREQAKPYSPCGNHTSVEPIGPQQSIASCRNPLDRYGRGQCSVLRRPYSGGRVHVRRLTVRSNSCVLPPQPWRSWRREHSPCVFPPKQQHRRGREHAFFR